MLQNLLDFGPGLLPTTFDFIVFVGVVGFLSIEGDVFFSTLGDLEFFSVNDLSQQFTFFKSKT